MALPSSGAISLLALQNEYGGSNPISISEYYRNGGLVPNSITTTTREPSSGEFYNSSTYAWITATGSNEVVQITWNGSSIGAPGGSYTSVTVSGFTYYRGTYRETIGSKPALDYYALYRESSTTTLVNQNVPTSGTISLSNFYGGRKT